MPAVTIPEEYKEAIKAISHMRYLANKENIKIAQKKFRAAQREDSEAMAKTRVYVNNYYQTVTKPKREALKALALAKAETQVELTNPTNTV